MLNTSKIIFTFLYALAFLGRASAQETPYYAEPSQRRLTNNEIALPNLKTEKVFWYFSANAGIKWTGHKITDNLDGKIVGEKQIIPYWEGNIGINRNDKWQLEFGYLNNPNNLIWYILEPSTRNGRITFGQSRKDHTLSMRYKKRAFILDKITKNSRFNLFAGLNVSPSRKSEVLSNYNLKTPTSPSRRGFEDTLFIKANFNQKAAPLTAEFGFELISRLGNPIEIGLYGKYMLSPKGIINSNINVDSYFGNPEKTKVFLNGSDFMAGITLRWNFLHGIRYLPDIK
jgi:hypothetical protein